MTSKQEQIEELKNQNNDLKFDLHGMENKLVQIQSKMNDLVKVISRSQVDLQMQRTALNNLKLFVQEKNRVVLEHIATVSTDASLICKKFTEENHGLMDNLKKVSEKLREHTIQSLLMIISNFFFSSFNCSV